MHRLLVIALSLLLTHPAAALIIDADDQERYARPPVKEKDPGWAYVAQRGKTSAVYLGNGWFLGVRHSGAGEIVLDGVKYPAVPNSRVQLVNPGEEEAKADLILFRVDPAPALPELPLGQEPLHFGTRLTLIGYGQGRGEALVGVVDAVNGREPRGLADQLGDLVVQVARDRARIERAIFGEAFDIGKKLSLPLPEFFPF